MGSENKNMENSGTENKKNKSKKSGNNDYLKKAYDEYLQEKKREEQEEREDELAADADYAHEKALNWMGRQPKEVDAAAVYTEMTKLKEETEKRFADLDKTLGLLDICLDGIDKAGNEAIANRNSDKKKAARISEAEQKQYEDNLKKEINGIKTDYEKTLDDTRKYLELLKAEPKKYKSLDVFDKKFQNKIEEFEENINKAKFHVDYPDLNKRLDDNYEKAFREHDEGLADGYISLKNFKEESENKLKELREAQERLNKKKDALVKERSDLFEKNGKDENTATRDEFTKRQEELNKEQKEFYKQLDDFKKKIEDRVKEDNKLPEKEQKKLKEKQDDALRDVKNEMQTLNFVRVNPSGVYEPFGHIETMKHMAERELQTIKSDMKVYNFKLLEPVRERNKKLNEIAETLEAVGDLKERSWFGGKKKEPQAFTDAKNAIFEYLNDTKDLKKASKAYEECRNYLSAYMKADGKSLKSGSKVENTRNQGIVRILELMDELPEFEKLTANNKANDEFDGFEVIEKESEPTYTKLSFKELEGSLAKHSSKTNSRSKNPDIIRKDKAFSDLNRQIAKNDQKNKSARKAK